MAQSGVLWVPRIQLIRGVLQAHTMMTTDLSAGMGRRAVAGRETVTQQLHSRRVGRDGGNLYRAVDKAGPTVDFLLTARRDRQAALRFLRKAIRHNATPDKITIDKSGANTAAIESHNTEHEAGIQIRQVKYLNNIVEQDHRAIKRLVRPMLGFKSFWSAAVTRTGIELMHMIRKGQLLLTGEHCPAQRFHSLAE